MHSHNHDEDTETDSEIYPHIDPGDKNNNDGYDKWFKGVSKPKVLIAALTHELFVYFSGCHLRYVKIGNPVCPVVRTFRPRLNGQPCLLEANNFAEFYAVAESGRRPRILVYKYDESPVDEILVCTLGQTSEFEIRAMQFSRREILVVLTGIPDFNISLWRWPYEEQILIVDCLESSIKADLLINMKDNNQWVEVGEQHITFYELQQFTENNVVRTEVTLPPRQHNNRFPDPLFGRKWAITIISACWTFNGEFFALDTKRGLHTIYLKDKSLDFIGYINFPIAKTNPENSQVENENAKLTRIFPYGSHVAAALHDGGFLVITVERGNLTIHEKVATSSGIKTFFRPAHLNNKTSFFALTYKDKKIEFIDNGHVASVYTFTDLMYRNIVSACFIEPDGKYLAILTNKGVVMLLDAETGNFYTKWTLPFPVASILAHPILPFFAVGTRTGCMVLLDIREIRKPKLIRRHFVSGDPKACLDRLAFIDFGFFLVAGDATLGHLYLQYAYTYGEFEFLDETDLPGEIMYLNTPPGTNDHRLQVVMRYSDYDECPVLLHNYTFETHTFELVASQAVDIPIKSICYSLDPRLQYAYQAEENIIGLVQYAEDMQTGALKDPEIHFKSQLALDVNKLVLRGDKLYCFGADGYTSVFQAPVGSKVKKLNRLHCVQSHMLSSGGIRDGIVSFDGTQIVTFGYDKTMVHIRLSPKPDKWNWDAFGLPNRNQIFAFQMREFALLKLKVVDPIVRKNERTVMEIMEEADDELDESQFSDVIDGLWKRLKKLSAYMGKLIDFNQTRQPLEQLQAAEFNLDSDDEDMMTDLKHNAKTIAECTLTPLVEARFDWVQEMKTVVWDDFQVKGSRFKGFTCKKEIMNYPLRYPTAEFLQILHEVEEERRMEIKIADLDDEIHKIGYQSSKDVVQVLFTKTKPKSGANYLKSIFEDKDDDGEPKEKKVTEWVDEDEEEEDAAKKAEKADHVAPVVVEEKVQEVKSPEDALLDEAHEDLEGAPKKQLTAYEARFGDLPERLRPSEHAGHIISTLSAVSSLTDFDSQAVSVVSSDALSLDEYETDVEDSDADTTRLVSGDGQIGRQKGKSFSKKQKKKKKDEEGKKVEVVYSKEKDKEHTIKELLGDMRRITPPEAKKDREYVDIVDMQPTSEDEDEYEELRKRPKKTEEEKAATKKKKKTKDHAAHLTDTEMSVGIGGATEEDSVSTDTDPDEEIVEIRKSEFDGVTEKELKMMNWFDQTFNGSLIFKILKPNPLLYHQFEVAGRHHLYLHHILTIGEIIRLKTHFNKEFEEARNTKASVLRETKKRNKRIREILEYLNVQLQFGDLGWDPKEDSEAFFTVKDRELLPVKKWYSEEELKAMELKKQQEEERRRLRATSFREKALYVMMDNKLVTRREDILKKDIPKPKFMILKEEWEYNLDEYFEAQEYYSKVEQLEIQRAEFRKELEIELHKLIRANVDARLSIDKRAEELFLLKQKVEENIRMEEIRLCRMMRQVLRRSTMQNEEERLNVMLRKLQDSLKSSQNVAAQLLTRAEKLNGRLDSISEVEKTLEKAFRRDLGEVGNFFDFFMKSYKKRPKFASRGFEKNPEVPPLMLQALQAPSIKIWGKENGDNGAAVAAALMELEDAMQNPIGCPRSSWDRFVRLRREKLVCEYETKTIGLELMNLHKILDECKRREEDLGNAIAAVLTSSSHERDVKLYHFHNFELQMCYPQGRVELPRYDRRSDFYNAAIIKQQYVERSNEVIKRVSALKFEELNKNIKQHSDLLRVEWKFKRASLKFAEVDNTFKDMLYMRVSKEIIDFLRSNGDIRKIQDHRIIRLHKLQTLSGKYHQIFLDDKAKRTRSVQESQQLKLKQNAHLQKKITKMNLDACEKVLNCDLSSSDDLVKVQQKRMQLVMRMGEMMRTVHRFVQDIDVLERELARQCHKTFPIF